MKCPEFEKLNLYIDNELSADVMSEVKHHLKTCNECRLFVEEAIASEKIIRHQIQQSVSSNSIKKSVMKAVKIQQVSLVSNRINKSFFFRFAIASMFSFILMFTLYFSYKKPIISNVFCGTSVQNSNLSSFIDDKPFLQSVDFKGSLSKYHHYSGSFIFHISFKGQISKISWIGSGTLLFSPEGQIEIQSGKGKLELISGTQLNVKRNGKHLEYTDNVIELQHCNSVNKTIVEKVKQQKLHEDKVGSDTCMQKNILEKEIASVSVSLTNVLNQPIVSNEDFKTNILNKTDDLLSSSPVCLDQDVTTTSSVIEKTKNPFEATVIKLTGGQE